MKRAVLTLAVGVTALSLASCASTRPTQPGVEKLGATVVRYSGPEAEVALSYRFANRNPGEEWLILETAITGQTGDAIDIERDKVFLITPDGARVALASQKEFAEDYPRLQATLRRADIASEPLDYWVGRNPGPLQFFAVPGTAVTYDRASVNDRQVLYGSLYFFLPGGVQVGTYQLGIDLTEEKIRIPFRITGQ